MRHFHKILLIMAMLACCIMAPAAYAGSTLTLPAGLVYIEDEAFLQAVSLGEVVLPDGVISIGARAFANSSITGINLPASIETIADNAFEGCKNFTATVVEGTYAHEWCVENNVQVELVHIHSFESGSCTCAGCGETFDISISFDMVGLNLVMGESITLQPRLQADVEGFDTTITYESTNNLVATVTPEGVIVAVDAGEAEIIATTSNGLAAQCFVSVLPEGASATNEFAYQSATIIAGDTAKVDVVLNKAAYEGSYALYSADEAQLSVDSGSLTITADSAAEGVVMLSLVITPAQAQGETALETMAEEISCPINIIAESQAAFSVNELNLRTFKESNPVLSQGDLLLSGIPDNLIGTYSLVVEDEELITYHSEYDFVQAKDRAGSTRIICKTYGREIICTVNVEYLPTYRAVIIGEYNNSSQTSSNLPFAANNLNAMKTTLASSNADGQTYDTIGFYPNNPTQAQIQTAIETTFADAVEGDVSLVYIVSHGYNGRADINNGGYFFGTPNWTSTNPDTIITSTELLNWLKPLKGNVVLLLDSCKSGGFLYDLQSEVAAEGNIAVITAQTHDKNAAYFNGSSALRKVEFLTYVFCYGLGYDYSPDDANYAYFRGEMIADTDGNGYVTIREIFDYTEARVPTLVLEKAKQYYVAGSTSGFLVPGVSTKAQLTAWGGQYPQVYIPSALEDVVLFGG